MNKLVKKETTDLEIIKTQVQKIRTLKEVVRLDNIILAEENKELLTEMIIDLNKFSNVSRKMNEMQIAETINNMFIEYPKISLQEYEIFFRRIKTGYFGQLYDSLDGIKIMAFLKEFYKELTNAYCDFKEEDHMKIKKFENHRDLYKY